jgi:hypothetical protein
MLIHARKLLQYTTQELWSILTGEFTLEFDDGVLIDTDTRATLYSSYIWDLHREYPNTPLNSDHHFTKVTKKRQLRNNTHLVLLENAYWALIDAYHLENIAERDPILKRVYEITNTLYNELSVRLEEYVVSIDLLDSLEIAEYPPIKEIVSSIKPTNASIKDAYERVTSIIETDKVFDNNPLARAFRTGIVKQAQSLQCLVARGFVTDVDSSIFPTPVITNFLEGLTTFYDILVESRSAAKALFSGVSPLQDAEYFSRRLHLLTTVVERLVPGDCGSSQYMLFRVNPPTIVRGKKTHKGDLEHIVGKYYLHEESNTLQAIKASDTHLEGKTIRMRTVLYCKHPDKQAICTTCFGELSHNVFPGGNIGHQTSVTVTRQTTQSVLSTKHLNTSSSAEPLVLDNVARLFFIKAKDGISFLMQPGVLRRELILTVNSNEARGLSDIYLTDIDDINPARISSITVISFTYEEKGTPLTTPVVVAQHKRSAMMTKELLYYIKQKGCSIDIRGNIAIDLTQWDAKHPILKLPETEYNYSAHSSQVAELIESKVAKMADRAKPDSPVVTLTELFDLVNSKLSVNIALLEVIVYATMIHSPNNYDLSRHSNSPILGIASAIIRNRSISNAMGYNHIPSTLLNPSSFFKSNRPDSIFDCLIKPYEATVARKLRGLK